MNRLPALLILPFALAPLPAQAGDGAPLLAAPLPAAVLPGRGPAGGPTAANVILPVAYATRWGENAGSSPFGAGPCRYQQVHLGTEIPAPTLLYGIGFREDETYSAFGGEAVLTIKLGMTSSDPATIGLTSQFDSNFDSRAPTTVFSGTVFLPWVNGSNRNFANFAMLIPFAAPYVHVPLPGKHLLFEVVTTRTANNGLYDMAQGATVTRIWATSATATNASLGSRNQGLVVCFAGTPTCGLATFATFGSGCAGSNGTPTHTALGVPMLGRGYTLQLHNARPGPGWLILDMQRGAWGPFLLPLDLGPFGAAGCSLLVPATGAIGVTVTAAGEASVFVPVANAPQHCGLRLYTQFVVADPANSLGFVVSNGGDATVGN